MKRIIIFLFCCIVSFPAVSRPQFEHKKWPLVLYEKPSTNSKIKATYENSLSGILASADLKYAYAKKKGWVKVTNKEGNVYYCPIEYFDVEYYEKPVHLNSPDDFYAAYQTKLDVVIRKDTFPESQDILGEKVEKGSIIPIVRIYDNGWASVGMPFEGFVSTLAIDPTSEDIPSYWKWRDLNSDILFGYLSDWHLYLNPHSIGMIIILIIIALLTIFSTFFHSDSVWDISVKRLLYILGWTIFSAIYVGCTGCSMQELGWFCDMFDVGWWVLVTVPVMLVVAYNFIVTASLMVVILFKKSFWRNSKKIIIPYLVLLPFFIFYMGKIVLGTSAYVIAVCLLGIILFGLSGVLKFVGSRPSNHNTPPFELEQGSIINANGTDMQYEGGNSYRDFDGNEYYKSGSNYVKRE